MTQKVLHETLRLYPPIPYNVRVALRDTTLPRGGGDSRLLRVGVPKDTLVGYSVLALQRSNLHNFSDFDVLEFEPDRWQGNAPKPWTYIPFNGGPRTCVGQQFALTEMAYTVIRILQCFERIEGLSSNGIKNPTPKLKAEIILQPRQGVYARLWRCK
jgi:cytochrome P450